MLTAFFTAEHIEAAARQTGFVKRTSKITGKIFLALVTFGVWSDAKTPFAPLAAKVTQVDAHVEVSPEAMYQRMNKRAIAFVQEMLRNTLAIIRALDHGCDDGLCVCFPTVYRVDSTGFELPDSLQERCPGAGGSAAPAGAKIQRAWEYKRSAVGHFALTPGNIPDNKYIDTVVA